MAFAPAPLFEIMSHPVYTIDREASVFDAVQTAKQHGIHHLPVMDGAKLVGMVCTCDLREANLDARISAVMKTVVATLSERDSVQTASQLMTDRQVGSIVIMTNGAPCGIVTREGLAQQGVELPESFELHRCSCCDSRQHLRLQVDGNFLCVDCRERSSDDPHFEPGTSG